MAPAAVFADHLAMKFVIVKPSDTAALAEVGAVIEIVIERQQVLQIRSVADSPLTSSV